MPYNKLNRKEKKFYYKPWITRGIKKKSMKTRDYLRNKMNKDKTEESEVYYKKFKNFVSRLQSEAYNNYYSNKVTKTFKNKKKLWETIGEITKYKKRKKTKIDKLKCNGEEIKDAKDIANCLNAHFNSIGQKMADKIRNPNFMIENR